MAREYSRDEVTAILRAMVTGAQRARSISLESMGDDALARAVLEETSPWLFGPRSVLPTLLKAVADAEAGKPISGADFVNLVHVATVSERSIAMCAINAHGDIIPQEPDYTLAATTW